MGAFFLLYSIDVEHSYFSDGICRHLDFVPARNTADLFGKMGLLTRPAAKGIDVFYDEERVEAIKLFADDKEAPLRFSYKVFSRDPLFINFTAPCIQKEDEILYFVSDGFKEGEEGRRKLHEGEYVSELDFEKLDSKCMAGIIGKREKLIKPSFIVDIAFAGNDLEFIEGELKVREKKCFIKFKAERTYWKYYLIGNLRNRTVFIADVENKNEFEFGGDETLPDKRFASVFLSKTSIPLREKGACSFQLREGSKGGGKVIIKSLPAASAERFGREIINGEERLVSEIYINN